MGINNKDIAVFFIVIFLWICIWGLAEIIIDKIVINNPQNRYIVYIILLIISAVLYYIVDTNL